MAWVAGLAVAAIGVGACSDGEEVTHAIVPTDYGDDPCAAESQPTPELDELAQRLEAAGYRVRYGGYATLGYFTDDGPGTELCADSALSVTGNGLGRYHAVDVRQFEDPRRLDEMAADVATFDGLASAVVDDLLYLTTAPKAKLDRAIESARG